MLKEPPVPQNEMQRLLGLSALDLDYTELSENFKDLTTLAAKVAGTEISLINLIDSYTQWTVSRHGLELYQMPREDSACQYTIMGKQEFEVPDFSLDERFKEKFYVKGPLALRYYYGIPLTDPQGNNIGALCVLDQHDKHLSPEKTELLKIIADQVMNRIQTMQDMRELQLKVKTVTDIKNKVAHDIRGPLAGIIGLSEYITGQGQNNNINEVIEFIQLINKSSKSLLDLADEILTEDQQSGQLTANQMNLNVFKYKLHDLYNVQAKNKGISLQIQLSEGDQLSPFPKQKLLQIAGNLISNAIKFTPEGGTVNVDIALAAKENEQEFRLIVADTGSGMTAEALQNFESGDQASTMGTKGEKGYGFGLALVKHLVNNLGGEIKVRNQEGAGATFEVNLIFKGVL